MSDIGSSSTTLQPGRRSGALSRYTFAGALAVALAVGAAVALAVSLGGSRHASGGGRAGARSGGAVNGHGSGAAAAGERPGAGERSAGGAAVGGAGLAGGSGAAHAGAHGAVALGAQGASVAEVRDPEEARSFPLPASVRHRAASTPSVVGETVVAAGAASDAEIRKELGEEERAKAQERALRSRPLTGAPGLGGGSSVGGNGTVPIPSDAPEVVQRVIAGGNAIADFPYIWGGGHGSFVDHGYDCSGSVSYALAAGGLLSAPLVSGDLASWGAPGPGQWITIYANAGHTFMNVDGMWFDTAGRSGPYASRWITATPPLAGYAVRHPQGL